MERLWSPWRAKYIASGVDSLSERCVFCDIAANPDKDDTNFVVHRSKLAFVVLNLSGQSVADDEAIAPHPEAVGDSPTADGVPIVAADT